jgi:PPOX class probable F420-dependent enzyme
MKVARRVEGSVELSDALDFARTTRQSVMATTRRDGRPQLSNVLHAVGPDGVIRVSTTAGRAKYRNLARDPWTALHVTQEDFWAYVVLEGAVELAPIIASVDDPGGDEHIEHYRLVVGEREDWDAFRASLVAERRSMIRLVPSRAYGMAALSAPDDG